MQIVDLAEQTRLLGQVAPTLESLRKDAERVQGSEISKPVRERAPIAVSAQELAMRCTQQLAAAHEARLKAVRAATRKSRRASALQAQSNPALVTTPAAARGR